MEGRTSSRESATWRYWDARGRYSLESGIGIARVCAYELGELATYGLWFTYAATLLLALLAAAWVSWTQIKTLKKERQFTRAEAHELKTPATVLRAYAEALREDASPGPVRVTLEKAGERAVLTVENRCGPIPPESLKRLWEPFYKLDEARSGEGSGLGLAVVKSIVTLHGGSCRAESLPDGVRFRIELPA